MKTLGVLCLSNRGLYEGADPDFGQGMADPRRYKIPPILRRIPRAWTSNIVPGDPACADEYAKAAQELVREGADAITCDCGFTVRYQQAIADAVSVPVSTSSLLLLPMLLSNVPANKKVAVLTYDSRYLDAGIMASLSIKDTSRLVIEGLEGTETYAYMWAEKGQIRVADALSDTDAIIESLRKREDIAAILCECTFFARVSPRIRSATGLPVYDAALNAALLVAAVG
ncbi:hypothetical protein [Bradyrhizobium arachidis]|uniref:hypothetical protein n=1 Tax=Bradyrhizobium arachidis TaxID=858423 RepID=UPI0008ECFD54|nr:hypothetical protein [Bradyrhizobium arachidis]SFV17429.1 hypothetical protein SAMN05192541_12871 [Bradyrhizobium arachidis]